MSIPRSRRLFAFLRKADLGRDIDRLLRAIEDEQDSIIANVPISLFGDGSDGYVVIDAPNTPIDDILNAISIHITSTGSIRPATGKHCILRAQQSIIVDGPINCDALIPESFMNSGVSVVQIIGAISEGSGGGGGGGASGASGNGLIGGSGATGGNYYESGIGFSNGTPSAGGAGGIGGVGGNGGVGADAVIGVVGVDIADLSDHLIIYPAGLAGNLHGSLPGAPGIPGVDGGAGSGGAAGGVGGLGGVESLGAGMCLIVAPIITLNALVSSNGGNGGNAPTGVATGHPTAGAAATGASNEGGGGGGSGGGGGAGAAGGIVCLFYQTLVENVSAQANPGSGGSGAPGAVGGAKDGTGHIGGVGGHGADGATGSPGFVIRQRIF